MRASSADREPVVSASFGVQFKGSPNRSNSLSQRSVRVYGFGPSVERQQTPTQWFDPYDYLETAAWKSKVLRVCVTAKLQKLIINIIITAVSFFFSFCFEAGCRALHFVQRGTRCRFTVVSSQLSPSHSLSPRLISRSPSGAFDLLIVPLPPPHHL